ncbi:hypothetical protein TSAR_001341 [Trichomalopsis sarcophagae]|uniref:Uncharacterized protein n=1 Tax=Trichomalopsis sarcophagae TaxID=543379 RepID=A0A232F709_9HYME|nr:hypothetical protein TSAR_001341 [Trichomalopsis sarcophagae]
MYAESQDVKADLYFPFKSNLPLYESFRPCNSLPCHFTQEERTQLQQRETSCCLSSVESRRDEKTEDAPHCVTCYCLPSKMKCSRYRQMYERCAEQQRTPDYNAGDYIRLRCNDEAKLPLLSKSSSSRRDDVEKRLCRRKTTTLDELLRQMKLDETLAEDYSKTEEDEQAVAALCPSPQQEHRRRRRHRPSGTGSYRNRHQVAKLTETSARNSSDGGQRWKNDDIKSPPLKSCSSTLISRTNRTTAKPSKLPNNSQCHNPRPSNSAFPQVVPRIEDIAADASANKPPNNDVEDWQQRRLEDNAALTVEKERSQVASEPEEAGSNLLKEFDGEAHVRELKLVRWDFIERIHEEVHKLYRLQRHLDSCSPRGPTVPHT